MAKLIMKSWRYGLEKVNLTKLQKDMLGLGLRESKDNVDALLEGKEIILEIEDDLLAEKFQIEIEKIGVNSVLIKDKVDNL